MRHIVVPYLSEAITGLVAAFASWFFTRRKSRAEGKKSELDVVHEAIKIWRETAEQLKQEILLLRQENKILHGEICKLRSSNHKIRKVLEILSIENFEREIMSLREKLKEYE